MSSSRIRVNLSKESVEGEAAESEDEIANTKSSY